jgi:hypothetical protein
MRRREQYQLVSGDGALCCRSQSAANFFAPLAGQSVGHLRLVLALSSIALLAADGWRELRRKCQKRGLSVLEATTCQQFNDDVKSNPWFDGTNWRGLKGS